MRVISGKYKGRVLDGYNIDGTRPTMDRVKMSLFGMIQDYIKDSYVLDLFSGSGNLAIEALSEGASFAVVVDSNKKCINKIKSNINNIGIDNIDIIYGDYKKVLSKLKYKFDIIFLDPPYKSNYIEESIKLIDKYDLVNDLGIIVCESDSIDKIKYNYKYREIKSKKYGDKYVVLLKKIL